MNILHDLIRGSLTKFPTCVNWFNSSSVSAASSALKAGKLKLPVPDGCPSRIYKLMVRCWALSLKERPSFTEIVQALGELPSNSKV